jgi:KaiC/GvpD/RAD55 family RecA-like ATPase
MPEVLRFGIHSLDVLLGVSSKQPAGAEPRGIFLAEKQLPHAGGAEFTTSVCVVGPSGTGKSIFGLHMASAYVADCEAAKKKSPNEKSPIVLYVSTDLTFNMADAAWRKFALDRPFLRKDPFDPRRLTEDVPCDLKIELGEYTPITLADKFEPAERRGCVSFVDMASFTAGDDWGFLHRLLSLLPNPGVEDPRHLVVIDAIEGFEALAGELNAFGEKSTRRARVAQVMRLITKKCHVVLIVEENVADERLAEEFVVDTVLRLGNITTRNYERRVLKIEKARGQSHTRGWHHYSIRSGQGSTTGQQPNPDDPRVALPADSEPVAGEKMRGQSYVQVFHSVHRLNRKIMEQRGQPRPNLPSNRYAAFGIKYLDNMLGGQHEFTDHVRYKAQTTAGPLEYHDTRGLPCSSTTALIGDSLTQKSALGRAFLSRSFRSFSDRLRALRAVLSAPQRGETENRYIQQYLNTKVKILTDAEFRDRDRWMPMIQKGAWRELWTDVTDHLKMKLPYFDKEVALDWDGAPKEAFTHAAASLLNYRSGQAVMLSTHDTDYEKLAREFIGWLHTKDDLKRLNDEMPGYEKALQRYIEAGTVCRRLEIHNLSSEILIHIVQKVIRHAQRKVMTSVQMGNAKLRYRHSWPIRLVIDDFSTFRDVIPELREDPLLLPTILFHFEREGITTLIIDTQSGKPDTPIAERFESELRKLVQRNLYTWRVPFYGESRVAITAIPPFSYEYAGIVRELRWETESSARRSALNEPTTTVDPHLELYTGLEEGKPQSVPLRVHLYAETPAMESYITTENMFLNEMFDAWSSRALSDTPAVLTGVPSSNYNELRDFVYLQRDTRLDHTLVFQVDEFWTIRAPTRRRRAGAFQPQFSYLNAITADQTGKPDADVDPYKLFQRHQNDKVSRPLRRRDFYKRYFKDFPVSEADWTDQDRDEKLIDRVPFIWDFGFLLCRAQAWDSARAFRVGGKEYRVRQVWRSLKKIGVAEDDDSPPRARPADDSEPLLEHVSWRIFIEACKKAAEGLSERLSKPVTAFDFAQISPESFSCLILEMWFSEIYDTLQRQGDSGRATLNEILETLPKRRLFLSVPGQAAKRPILLADLLEKYWLELYKSWLILIEVLNFSDIIGEATALNMDFKSRNTDFTAIASRHWYKTAAQCPNDIAAAEPLVAVRLPGHFSVRGDWSLAISGSSRSIRQGERILDLLNSRRAQVSRLQLGIGLPTRFPDEDDISSLRTRLISHRHGQDNIEYGTLLKIGAGDNDGFHHVQLELFPTGNNTASDNLHRAKFAQLELFPSSDQAVKDGFHWLWRSSLDDYAHCNRIWHKWLNRTLLSWYRNLLRYKSVWRSSFLVYDELTEQRPSLDTFAPTNTQMDEIRQMSPDQLWKKYKVQSVAQLQVRRDFRRLWEVLIKELKQAAE